MTYRLIEEHLRAQTSEVLHIRHVPNLRLARDLQAVAWVFGEQGPETVGDWRDGQEGRGQRLGASPDPTSLDGDGLDPEDLWELGERLGYQVDISWSARGESGECEVLFSKGSQRDTHIRHSTVSSPAQASLPTTRWSSYANNPLQGKMMQTWLPALRQYLQEYLPEYMIPAQFVLLESLPLTPNGKVDRRALPASDLAQMANPGELVAPRTTTEELLVALWSQLLGRELVSCNQSFFALGGHSLLATRLLFLIKETFQVELPLRAIFEAPTLTAMAQMIDALRAGTTLSTRLAQERAWYEDAVLDPTIGRKAAQVPVISQPAAPSGIFLTGATGFLGVHLLYALLQQTQATIYCLVRASSLEQGRQKLYHQLAVQQLWDGTIDETRIVPVPGDLASPLFGLSKRQFSALAEQIEVIYHNGARVHLMASYADLKAANVLGTQEVLRLACTGEIKPVHHISTLGVLALPPEEDDKIIDENVYLDVQRDQLVDGYSQSKWVAEKLIQQAHERGIPTCVYRLGRVGGHTGSGAWNPGDYLCRWMRGCIQLGRVPDVEDSLDVTPVDYMSEAIVHLSCWAGEPGKIFHLFNPKPPTVADFLAYGRSFGYRLERVVYEEWRNIALQVIQEEPETCAGTFALILSGATLL